MERDKTGRFVKLKQSLEKKLISFRLSKDKYPEFISKAQALGIKPTALARKIVEEWLDKNKE